MTEFLDLYNQKKEKIGQIVPRNSSFPEDKFYLTVHIWVYQKNYWLIQKRALSKKANPGLWSVTGGAVKAGESSIEGAIRELYEEVNIRATANELKYKGTYLQKQAFVDVYFLEYVGNKLDISFNKREISAVKWCSLSEIIKKSKMNTFASCVLPGLIFINDVENI